VILSTETRAIAFVLFASIFVPSAYAEVTRPILKTYFESGDIPSGQDFKDVIDSTLNLVDDGLTVYRIGADSFGHAIRLDLGTAVDGSLSYTPASNYPLLAPNWLGQFGFLPLELRDTTAASHYGFLQLQMAGGPAPPPPGSPGPAIFVDYLVFQTDANVPITTFATPVPEPTSLLLLGCIMLGAFVRRSYRIM
jgi:hypothetical protein